MKEVLIVSIGFSPNMGGIETHFDDLVTALVKCSWKVYVLTYKPVTTDVKASIFEKHGKNVFIYRIPWFGKYFYNFVKKPFLEFIYLTPGLFITLPIFLILKGKNIRIIHSHGLIAGMVAVFWGKVFNKKVITTTHSIYNFPQSGMYRTFAAWIFKNSNHVLTLSNQSKVEIEDLGVQKNKVIAFKYWIDLNNFKKINNAKKLLNLGKKFTVLFVGRLIPEKGILELLKAATSWDKRINLLVVGVGPLESNVIKASKEKNNILYIGSVNQNDLPRYYSAADLLIVPSIHEEGFGRVILESLACGTPVLGSNRGAIPEAMDNSVGKLINISPASIIQNTEYYLENQKELQRLANNTRVYAINNYSEKNVEKIIKIFNS